MRKYKNMSFFFIIIDIYKVYDQYANCDHIL